MCKVGSKSYPVTVNETMNGGTISWRGTIFENLELEEGCKVNFVATKNGVKAELCAATKGYADLTIGKAMFNCQMKQ